jgi:hydroxymethylpyrimidine pyrophosphatase-like HAD family hydrolase
MQAMTWTTSHPRFDAIICDIDGCLSDEGTAPFDLDALSKIAAHNRRAIERRDVPILTVCSGRPQPFAEAMCRAIHNTELPCVAENGVWLYHPGTNVYDMDPSITRQHLDAVNAASAWIREGFGPRGVSQQPGKSASISLYHDDTPYLMDEVMPAVSAGVQVCAWPLRVSRTERYVNLDLTHISKSTALDRLFEQTGLTRERLAGIGDSASDLAIRERVAFFACPANAIAELKDRADLVAGRSQVKGVLEIIDALVD